MKYSILVLSALLLLTSCWDVSVDTSETKTTNKKSVTTSTEKTTNTTNETIMKKNDSVQTAKLQEWDIIATMKTSNGVIKIKLFPKLVPHTANNFIGLAQNWYYDWITFHRVINNFMIQWGDPTATWAWWESLYWDKFDDEFSAELSNIPWSISMANAWPNTNWSQFFINQGNNENLDFNKPPFTSKHSVFWQVIEGMDNINKIAKTKTGAWDKPVKDVKIISITLEEYTWGKQVPFTLDIEKAKADYVTSIEEAKESKKTKEIVNWDTASVHYTLKLEDGTKIDSSIDRGQPFEFEVWAGMVIPGWEKGLVGHKIWDKFALEIDPKEWYGVYDETKTQEIDASQISWLAESGEKLEAWSMLQTAQWNVKVLKVDGDKITLDLNHELAWKKLFFDIEIIDIK